MADEEPAKGSVTNLVTNRTFEFQFNPEQIGAKIGAVYEDLAILGLSHKPQQYKVTENAEIPIDLMMDRLTSSGANFDAARRFYMSLVFPAASTTVIQSGPPNVLFVWPNLYSLVCKVREWGEKHTRFARDGRSTLMVIHLVLHRVQDIRLIGSQVEEGGLEEG